MFYFKVNKFEFITKLVFRKKTQAPARLEKIQFDVSIETNRIGSKEYLVVLESLACSWILSEITCKHINIEFKKEFRNLFNKLVESQIYLQLTQQYSNKMLHSYFALMMKLCWTWSFGKTRYSGFMIVFYDAFYLKKINLN